MCHLATVSAPTKTRREDHAIRDKTSINDSVWPACGEWKETLNKKLISTNHALDEFLERLEDMRFVLSEPNFQDNQKRL
jgi:hypothetical protein